MTDIEKLTIGEAHEISRLSGATQQNTNSPYQELVGKNIQIRTVTMIYTGRLCEVHSGEMVLLEAAWIPETGRWAQFISSGEANECEPYPDETRVIINKGAILDVCEIRAPLPRRQK